MPHLYLLPLVFVVLANPEPDQPGQLEQNFLASRQVIEQCSLNVQCTSWMIRDDGTRVEPEPQTWIVVLSDGHLFTRHTRNEPDATDAALAWDTERIISSMQGGQQFAVVWDHEWTAAKTMDQGILIDPRMIGSFPESFGRHAALRSRPRIAVGSDDRVSTTQHNTNGYHEVRVKRQDGAVILLRFDPTAGSTLSHCAITSPDGTATDATSAILQEHQLPSGDTLWYPRKLTYTHSVNGTTLVEEVAVIDAEFDSVERPDLSSLRIPIGTALIEHPKPEHPPGAVWDGTTFSEPALDGSIPITDSGDNRFRLVVGLNCLLFGLFGLLLLWKQKQAKRR